MSGESFVPSMISVSNRTVIDRMKKWGWREKRTKADMVLMEAPNGAKIEVKRAGIHEGNSKTTFQNLLVIMEMSWEQFITPLHPDAQGVLDWYVTLSGEEQERYRQKLKLIDALDTQRMLDHQRDISRRANIEKRKKREAEKKAHTFPVEVTRVEPKKETIVEAPKPTPPPKRDTTPLTVVPTITEVAGKISNRGATNSVLDLLVKSSEPMSLDRLCRELPQFSRGSINQAASQLVITYGVAERVKPAVYRIKPEARREDVRVGLDITARSGPPLAEVTSGPVTSAVAEPAPETPLPPTPPPVVVKTHAPAGDYDEMVNETLDLLFPEGFKARHLPLIDTWRQATLALMRDING